jgi:hypothetical protein
MLHSSGKATKLAAEKPLLELSNVKNSIIVYIMPTRSSSLVKVVDAVQGHLSSFRPLRS